MFLSAVAAYSQDSSGVGEQSGFAYGKTTFSSQREILDFIKSLDFDKNPPSKRLKDFYGTNKKITYDPALRKGIDMYLKGKGNKAAKYFEKIYENRKYKYTEYQRKYAAWQIQNYRSFGIMDEFYDSLPSLQERNNNPTEYKTNVYIWPNDELLLLYADPHLNTYNPFKIISYFTYPSTFRSGNITQEYVAALLYEAFHKGTTIKLDNNGIDGGESWKHRVIYYYCDGKENIYKMTDRLIKSVQDFFIRLNFLHLIAQTNCPLNEFYGIGLDANELYLKAKKLIPNIQIDITDYNSAKERSFYYDKTAQYQVLLLRSAAYGNPDAILELYKCIVQEVQLAMGDYYSKSKYWKRDFKEDSYDSQLSANMYILDHIQEVLDRLANLEQFKQYAYIWDAIRETQKSTRQQLASYRNSHREIKEAKEREKKAKRAQFWNNMAGVLLNGLAAGVNTYMAMQNHGGAPMNTATVSPGSSYSGSLADAMSQPGYFQREQQKLLQQSMNQVMWQEQREYQQAREAYQRMGRDLTLDEFRRMQGQAIANLKEQGYDVIAEQKAINQELHDFNRSQMNSGKENVQRIKERNDMKNGTTHSSSSSLRSTTSWIKLLRLRQKSQKMTPGNSTSTTGYTTNNRDVSSTSTSSTKNNAHEQYKRGNFNTNTSSYGDRIKNVSMAVKDGSSYRNVSIHGELYKKGSRYFVKIGSTFFKVESAGGYYNSYIIYGAKAHYFNK